MKRILIVIFSMGVIVLSVFLAQDISHRIQNQGKLEAHFSRLYAQEMFEAINLARKEENLSPYYWYEGLLEAADLLALEITEKMAHERPDGTPFFSVHPEVMGENIAKGFETVEAVMIGFMESDSHRDAILSKTDRFVSCSVYYFDGVYYYVQLFK